MLSLARILQETEAPGTPHPGAFCFSLLLSLHLSFNRTGHWPTKPTMGVRVPPGALCRRKDREARMRSVHRRNAAALPGVTARRDEHLFLWACMYLGGELPSHGSCGRFKSDRVHSLCCTTTRYGRPFWLQTGMLAVRLRPSSLVGRHVPRGRASFARKLWSVRFRPDPLLLSTTCSGGPVWLQTTPWAVRLRPSSLLNSPLRARP